MFFIMMLLTKVHSIQIRGRNMIKLKMEKFDQRDVYATTIF